MNKKLELNDIKWIIGPVIYNCIWLGTMIIGFVSSWGIDYPMYIMFGTVLIIVSLWTFFSMKIEGRTLIIGLNLFSFAMFLMMLRKMNMPLINQHVKVEFSGILIVISFIIITIGTKKVVDINLKLFETLSNIANKDDLTNLMNRRAIAEELEGAIEDKLKKGGKAALFMLDFDNFKYINDSYGHDFGDKVLVSIAKKISEMCGDGFSCGRLGGDEFLIIQRNVSNDKEIKDYAKDILLCFDEVYNVDGISVHMSTSIGVSVFPRDGKTKSELLVKADIALYKAKKSQKNSYEIYDIGFEFDDNINDIKVSIINGLKHNDFEAYFQPISKLSDNNVSSLEALARWKHAGRVISPEIFIPVAEKYGLITEIDFYVLRKVCELNKYLMDAGIGNVSVNFSAKTIIRSSLINDVKEIIEGFDVEPSFLTFEITETAVITNEYMTYKNITGIRALGCSISLDDFGTGFSSLNHLKNLPVNSLKIDKSFIDGIGNERNDEIVVKCLLGLAHELGIETIAEGVEKKEQLEFLNLYKCDKVQGYYIGIPDKIDNILKLERGNATA